MGNPRQGEPTFTLRAQDKLAPETIEAWARMLEMAVHGVVSCEADASKQKIKEARAIAHQMRAWQELHFNKIPD